MNNDLTDQEDLDKPNSTTLVEGEVSDSSGFAQSPYFSGSQPVTNVSANFNFNEAGSIQSAEILEALHKVNPDLATRAMVMAETNSEVKNTMLLKEQEHNHEMNNATIELRKKELDGEFQLKSRGQLIAGAIGLSFFVCAIVAILNSMPWLAGISTLTGLLFLIDRFLYPINRLTPRDHKDEEDSETSPSTNSDTETTNARIKRQD